MTAHRFGTEITPEDIVEALSFFDNWEDRYKYLIDLGKELPAMGPAVRSDENLVRGCQSQVWLLKREEGGRLYFQADSDSFIVKGLLGVVLAAYNGKTAQEIRQFDINAYFEQLGLLNHLSPTRGNGLQAMVRSIQVYAG